MNRVIVIGAGAAGSMAAIFAARGGAETLLLERTKDGGRKILISGGGRCNILPATIDESRFVSASPPFLVRRILRSWPLRDQIAFFEGEVGVTLVEEAGSNKLFPRSQSGRDVRDRLLACARRHGARLVTDTTVTSVTPHAHTWRVVCSHATYDADAVVLATGGLSVPHTGSDGGGLRIAGRLGLSVTPTYPALTPLLSPSGDPLRRLAGVSLTADTAARSPSHQARASGGFLFTHVGYSGPAVLDVSHVVARALREGENATLTVRWSGLTDDQWRDALQPLGARSVAAAVGAHVPHRLAAALVAAADVPADRVVSQLTRPERERLILQLTQLRLDVSGDEGYRKAEVTGGGVSLGEVDPATLESRAHRRLFLCGEILDAFGPIGGYNFLWAWATGRAAGLAAAGG